MTLNSRRGLRAVGSGALALALVGGWSLALQVGTGTVEAFAQSGTDPVNLDPVIDPDVNPSTISYITSSGEASVVDFDSLLTVGGADVGVDTIGGTVCATTGVETVGVGCLAGGALIAAPALYAGGKMVFHAIWGSDHTAPPASCPTGVTCYGYVTAHGYYAYETNPGLADGSSWELKFAMTGQAGSQSAVIGLNASGQACASMGGSTSGSPTTRDFGPEASFAAYATAVGYSVAGTDCYHTSNPAPARVAFIPLDSSYNYSLTGTLPFYGTVPSAGDDHNLTATEHCSDGSVRTGSTGTFNDSTSTPPNLSVDVCPAGTYPTSIGVTDSDTGAHQQQTTTWTAPPEWGDPTDPYAECDPGGSDVPCRMIWQVAATEADTVDESGESTQWDNCTDIGCPDLGSALGTLTNTRLSAKKLTLTHADVSAIPDDGSTENYRCLWGPYHVEAQDCKDGGSRTSGDGSTPPVTSDSDDCFPNGWGLFNPKEWVEKPVKCALVWAFEPDQGTIDADTQTVTDAFNGSALGTVVGGFGDMLGAVEGVVGGAGVTNCEGPPLPAVPAVGLTDPSYPFDACAAPMATWAAWCHGLLTFFVYLGGGYVALVVVANAFGFRLPWVKIVPWYNNPGNEQGELF